MFQAFIEGMLGPSGRMILQWYVANSLYINGVIVIAALLYIIFPAQGRQLSDGLKRWYLQSPLAPDEKDRAAIDKRKNLLKSNKARRK
jgi:hypothetical protein